MSIGDNIKKYRKQNKLTQKQLAEKLGKSYSVIQKYEIGIIEPPLDMLKQIAFAFGIPVSYLLDEVDSYPYSQQEVIAAIMENNLKIIMNDDTPQSKILFALDKLNQTGKETAVQRVEELTQIEKYTKSDSKTEFDPE